MLRGITRFKCDNCGKKFIGLDFEWCATALTAPVKCPKCGSMRTYPIGLLFGSNENKSLYKDLWELIEKNNDYPHFTP